LEIFIININETGNNETTEATETSDTQCEGETSGTVPDV
jgi:hypothetical protein